MLINLKIKKKRKNLTVSLNQALLAKKASHLLVKVNGRLTKTQVIHS